MSDTHETKVISDLLRNPERVMEENQTIKLTQNLFVSNLLGQLFGTFTTRLSAGKSIEPRAIMNEEGELLRDLSGFISGLAMICQMALNREHDGAFKKSAAEIKHAATRRTAKNLKGILAR